MTYPVWAPAAVLVAVCAVFPPPRWIREVNWLVVGALVWCCVVWAFAVFLIWWLV